MNNFAKIIHKEFPVQPTLSKFVDWVEKTHFDMGFPELMIFDYNNLLKQPLELKYLVPVKDGEVLSDPELTMRQGFNGQVYYDAEDSEFDDYEKAMESVLYEGFEYSKNRIMKFYADGSRGSIKLGFYKNWPYLVTKPLYIIYNNISDLERQPITLNFWNQLLNKQS